MLKKYRQGRRAGVDQPAAAVPRERHGRREAFQAAARQAGQGVGRCTTRCTRTTRRSSARRSEKYAGEVGLNVAKFKKDMGRSQDQGRGRRRTRSWPHRWAPTARRPSSSTGASWWARSPFAAFEKIIDEEIKKADELIKKGTPLKDVYKKLMRAGRAPPRRRRRPPRRRPPEGKVRHQARRRARQRARRRRQVTVIEFSDFQCPFCSRAVPDAQADRRRSTRARCGSRSSSCRCRSTTRRTWRPRRRWPRTSRASSGRMHDKLFANQQALDRAVAREIRRRSWA